MLSDAFELQIKLDRVVSAGSHRDFVSPSYLDSGEVSVCGRVNRQSINVPLFEWLTAQVKCRRMQIQQVRQIKLLAGCLCGSAFAFCSWSSHSTASGSVIRSGVLRPLA